MGNPTSSTLSSLASNDAHISIPVGIVIGILASSIQSLGLTIQRKSHVLNQQLPEHRRRVEHRRPLWLLGFAIFITSNVLGSLVQIAALPVVILAPLGAVSLLWNAFFARFLLGDVFSPWMVVGTILIAGGAILIAIFGIVPEPTRSLEDLLILFSRPAFVAYFSCLGIVVFVCLLATHIIDFSSNRHLTKVIETSIPATPRISASENPSILTAGITNTLSGSITNTERTPLLAHDRKSRSPDSSLSPSPSLLSPRKYYVDSYDQVLRSIYRTRLLLAISYASFSGIISGMCLLFAKSGVELLLLTLQGNNQFWRWQAWVLVLGLIAFALLQLWYLHKALILANPTLVCPSAFCFYNVSSIINGLVYFDQFSLIPPLHFGLVVLGMVILLGGIWVISMQSGEAGPDESDSDEETSISEVIEAISVPSVPVITEEPSVDIGKRIRPIGMERMTKSESYVDRSKQAPSTEALGSIQELGLGRPPPALRREQSSQYTPAGEGSRRSVTLPVSHAAIAESTPMSTSFRQFIPSWVGQHRRTQTTPVHGESPTQQHAYGTTRGTRALPHPQRLNTVSTLGTGLQIGLSPVSPGFAIMPKEKGRRRNGMGMKLGWGLGFGYGNWEGDTTSGEGSSRRERRQTVSEGDLSEALARRRAGGLSEERRVSEVGDSMTGGITTEHEDLTRRRKGKGKAGSDTRGGRWAWLKIAVRLVRHRGD